MDVVRHLLQEMPKGCKCEICEAAHTAAMICSLQTHQYSWAVADKLKKEIEIKYSINRN